MNIRKTKIVCTIGPASENCETMEKLIKAGMNVARLNFSHGDYTEHGNRIKTVKMLNKKLGKHVAILADTKGPEIRVGKMENDAVNFETGDMVTLTSEEIVGTHERFQVVCNELFDDVQVGNKILIDDGKMTLIVKEIVNKELLCEVQNSGVIKTKKGVNVPNVVLSMPFISEKDDADIRFAARNDADYIAASFVRRADDVLAIKKILSEEGNTNIEIIAKIENQEGYDNLKSIMEVADGVMVARGDLGVEVSLQFVPIYQKKIIALANSLGKPVITATHMLESMTGNPRPTRAEASDVANAILDGSDAIMLSAETAAGKYPVEAVETMNKIALVTEDLIDYRKYITDGSAIKNRTKNEVIGIAVSESCLSLENVSCVLAFTETGGTPKRLCRFRPCKPLIAATNSERTAKKLAVYWGVFPVYDPDITDVNLYDETANNIAKELKIKKGSTMILTAGWKAGHGNTNTMRYIEVEE